VHPVAGTEGLLTWKADSESVRGKLPSEFKLFICGAQWNSFRTPSTGVLHHICTLEQLAREQASHDLSLVASAVARG